MSRFWDVGKHELKCATFHSTPIRTNRAKKIETARDNSLPPHTNREKLSKMLELFDDYYRNAKAPVVDGSFDFSKPEDRAKVMPMAAALYDGCNHGWTVRGSQVYNEAGAERAWAELLALYKRNLA
jgi:hypothetical protein